jgi:hypothetical protein
MSVQIVPVVKHAQPQSRRFANIDCFQIHAGLQHAQQMEHAVQHADIPARSDQQDIASGAPGALDQVALFAQRVDLSGVGGDQPRGSRCADNQCRARRCRTVLPRRAAKQAGEPAHQLVAGSALRGCPVRGVHV